jgi:hypothetical protein
LDAFEHERGNFQAPQTATYQNSEERGIALAF